MNTIFKLLVKVYPDKANDGVFIHLFHTYFNITGICITEHEKEQYNKNMIKAAEFLNHTLAINLLKT
jgi:hypothetical protein